MTPSESSAGRYEARRTVADIMNELDSTYLVYRPAYQQVAAAGHLDAASRPAVIRVIASVATTLRRVAPSLAETQSLSAEERPDLGLVLLRLITDSLSVALADRPVASLMLDPDDVDEFFTRLRGPMPHA